MALRKAMGAVKDQTSIGIAKVSSNMAPELEVAIVKATSHDDEPASEKHIREILQLTSYSRGYVSSCVHAVSKRLSKTRDWIVALKSLVLIHRLLNDGDMIFRQEIMYATRKGTRLLNMADFRDEAHSNSWDHSTFVRTYGFYLDQKLDLIAYERKQNNSGNDEPDRFRDDRWRSPPNQGNDYGYNDNYGGNMRRSRSFGDVREGSSQDKNNNVITPLRDMKPERIFGKMGHLQRLLDRMLSCRPTGLARNSRLVLVALYPIVQESFKLYADICEVLAILLDRFFDMEYRDCVKAFDAYVSAAKQIDELVGFYNWCKDMGISRSSDYPEVQKITAKLLETLEEFVRDRAKAMNSPEKKPEVVEQVKEEEPEYDMNEIKALPPPETPAPPPPPPPPPVPEPPKHTGDLVDLREDGGLTADDQGNRFALALFAGPAANKTNGNWEAFGPDNGPEVTSAWQNPAAEAGKADWELALVETASNLEKQKAAMGGGLDPLLLNGMYDQGMVRQHVSSAQLGGGSASSVALPSKTATPVLALPAPDGSVQTVGGDPFAASLSVPPPSYVQMADMEKKQQLLVQEQMVWQQYGRNGMQGQSSLTNISNGGYIAPGQQPMMPYGYPPVNGAGYYYPNPY